METWQPLLALACLLALTAGLGWAAPVSEGLILHLDAAAQVAAGGLGPENNVWTNLAGQPDSVAGSVRLRHFGESVQYGWVGDGSPTAPYALRFDGKQTYGQGPGNLELPELTLEAWARVEGHTLRAATLIGNDFGKGGISLQVASAAETIQLIHGVTFAPVDAEVSRGDWHQVVAVISMDQALFYVDGAFACALPLARELQPDHLPAFELGGAHFPEQDYAAADGLIGELGLVRVYNRLLSPTEVKTNFEADQARFAIRSLAELGPVSSMPVPQVPGLSAPPVRCLKWDYYYNPVRVVSNATNAQWAFNGYPASVTHPVEFTTCTAPAPTPEQPIELTINYRRPVALTKFVHYFEGWRNWGAWREVEVYTSPDRLDWQLLESFTDLPPDFPQVLAFDQPRLAQYYKVVVKTLEPATPGFNTQELEAWYGASVTTVETGQPVQSEPLRLRVRLASPDAALSGATVKLIAPDGALSGALEAPVSAIEPGSSALASLTVTPLIQGEVPLRLELWAGGFLIDQRPYTLRVAPKLVFSSVTPTGGSLVETGSQVKLTGQLTNAGATAAEEVQLTWQGKRIRLGTLAPDASAGFELNATAKAGYTEGGLVAKSTDGATTILRRAIITAKTDTVAVQCPSADWRWSNSAEGLAFSARLQGAEPLTGELRLLVAGAPVALTPVGNSQLAALVPGAVLLLSAQPAETGDLALDCRLIPDDPTPLVRPWTNLDFQLGLADTKVCFRPHIDWYTVEQGPNFKHTLSAGNSPTRMLCLATDDATLSLVPDCDNTYWGFTPDNRMTANFQVPLGPRDQLSTGLWRPVLEAPDHFRLTLAARLGDWWEAYRHIVADLFQFEQPRQWAMPISQMQQLTIKELMSAQAWSERWQNTKVLSSDDLFWPFYSTAYALPALYSWYLATDDTIALDKSHKVVDWLLAVEQQDGPMAGGWNTSYWAEGDPPRLVGGDFIRNRWFIPHGTGAVVKTLMWYWKASDGQDGRVLAAAKRGGEWLLRTMKPDGGWPYAFDSEGNRITDQCGAGQIWCTWALWELYQATGDERYQDAALRSKDYFRDRFMAVHRYVGYWEDTVGISKQQTESIGSWEGYEPALAILAFSEMGDEQLALAAAEDAAVHSWTRVPSTRTYETSYGQTTEQATCGPSQAQSPLVGVAFHEAYKLTGEPLWHALSGAVKAVNFCADPEQNWGMVATSGWNVPLAGVAGPPYENVRPSVTPDMQRGDYGRQLWTGWCTDQFAWLALEWLVREANSRAPEYLSLDPVTFRGTVLGAPGRVKLPESKCDITSFEHYDINWVGYQNDLQYALLVMNHKEAVRIAVRPQEAHLDVYTRPPKLLISDQSKWREVEAHKDGIQYIVEVPAEGNALFIWDRIK